MEGSRATDFKEFRSYRREEHRRSPRASGKPVSEFGHTSCWKTEAKGRRRSFAISNGRVSAGVREHRRRAEARQSNGGGGSSGDPSHVRGVLCVIGRELPGNCPWLFDLSQSARIWFNAMGVCESWKQRVQLSGHLYGSEANHGGADVYLQSVYRPLCGQRRE